MTFEDGLLTIIALFVLEMFRRAMDEFYKHRAMLKGDNRKWD